MNSCKDKKLSINAQRSVFVLGSINVDTVISLDRFPKIGETIVGHDLFVNQGGKGANQAVACRKLGVKNTYLLSAVGDDINGQKVLKEIKDYGVDVSGVEVIKNNNTGSAFIMLDESIKDNVIVIEKGANNCLNPLKVMDFLKKHAKKGDILISQLEINIDIIYKAFEYAKSLGMYTILNPAPVIKFNNSLYQNVDLLIPNETECELLSDIKLEEDNLREIYKKFGVNTLIITLGSKGSIYIDSNEIIKVNALKVPVVDTTCAGDTFIGALAFKLSIGENLKESLNFASKCSSITISRKGAAKSIPYLEEILLKI